MFCSMVDVACKKMKCPPKMKEICPGMGPGIFNPFYNKLNNNKVSNLIHITACSACSLYVKMTISMSTFK